MKYEDAVKIEELASDVEAKRQAYQAHRMMNTPTDPEEAKQAFVALTIAQVEYDEAVIRLSRAKTKILYG